MRWWLTLLCFVAVLGVGIWRSSSTPRTSAEAPALRASAGLDTTVLRVARLGISELRQTGASSSLQASERAGGVLCILGAWSKLSIGRVGLLDPLTSRRLPWLVLAALGAVLAFALVGRAGGVLPGAVAAAVLLLHPSWGGQVDTGLVVGVSALGMCWFHAQAGVRPGGRRLCWNVLGGAWVGLCMAISRETLVALPVLLLYPALLEPSRFWEEMKRGRLLASSGLAAAVVVGIPVMLALSPSTWRGGPLSILRLAVAELSAVPAASQQGLRTDWAQVLSFVLAGLGSVLVIKRLLARRFATGSYRPGPVWGALPTLALAGGVFALVAHGAMGSLFAVFGATIAGSALLAPVNPWRGASAPRGGSSTAGRAGPATPD